MKTRVAVREALLNVWTGTARALLLAGIVLTLAISLQLADLATVRSIDAQARQFQLSGASVLIISAPGRIDGRLCESLASVPDVRAAGALRHASPTAFAVLPQQSLPVFEATPGFASVIRAEQGATAVPGALLSADAARAVGATIGAPLNTIDATARVAGVFPYPSDGRASGYGYSLVNPVPSSGVFDECWVDQWPQSARLSPLLQGVVDATVSTDDTAPTVAQLNSTHGERLDAHALYSNRITAWGLPLATVAAFALAIMGIRLRRLEFASMLHLGVGRRTAVTIALTETAIWVIPALIAGALTSTVFAMTASPGDAGASFLLATQIPLGAIAGAALGTTVGVIGIGESQLFRYFKER